jgi:D-aminoacyl-tRNA deacylase
MKVVVQRVLRASVTVETIEVGAIGSGLTVFIGITHDDTKNDATFLAKKVARLRVFPDKEGKMSRSVIDIQGEVLVVSQFTLYGSCKKGCRPDFIAAAPPSIAEPLYEYFLSCLEQELGKPTKHGRFREMMHVSLVNDGPVTILIESR